MLIKIVSTTNIKALYLAGGRLKIGNTAEVLLISAFAFPDEQTVCLLLYKLTEDPCQPIAMDTSIQPQLQIFNPIYVCQDQDQEPVFHVFPLLTTELRLQIWKHALRSRQRLLRVQLYAVVPDQGEHTTSEIPLDTAVSIQSRTLVAPPQYTIIVEGYKTLSKFMRVNREARIEALRYYRVHIPCRLTSDPHDNGQQTVAIDSTTPGILYFNPESDFLHLDNNNALRASDDSLVDHTLVDFVHQLRKQYDPQGVGLLNLAFGGGSSMGYEYIDLDSDHEATQTFLAMIQQLRQVHFLIEPRAGRLNFRWIYGMDQETFFTRSFPIMPLTPSFELPCQRDPRPIGKELKRIRFGISEPRETPAAWNHLLRKWGVPRNLQAEHRYLLALQPDPVQFGVYDRVSANKLLIWEDHAWRHPDAGEFIFGNEDLEKAVKPAFGFWLFDMNTFGHFTKEGDIEGAGTRGYKIWNLNGFEPELALSILP